jgi:hypothetical protein
MGMKRHYGHLLDHRQYAFPRRTAGASAMSPRKTDDAEKRHSDRQTARFAQIDDVKHVQDLRAWGISRVASAPAVGAIAAHSLDSPASTPHRTTTPR